MLDSVCTVVCVPVCYLVFMQRARAFWNLTLQRLTGLSRFQASCITSKLMLLAAVLELHLLMYLYVLLARHFLGGQSYSRYL